MTPHQQICDRGYYVARSVLERRETAALRQILSEHFTGSGVPFGLGRHQPHARDAIPAIQPVLKHSRIIEVLDELTDGRAIEFTGNCDAHRNVLNPWHRDFMHEETSLAPSIIRVGIYLQDHDANPRGLHVRPGSHHLKDASHISPVRVPTREGDVTFHDVRLAHSGARPDLIERSLVQMQRLWRTPRLSVALHDVWYRMSGRPDKFALFFTYGVPGPQTDIFRAEENDRRTRWKNKSTVGR